MMKKSIVAILSSMAGAAVGAGILFKRENGKLRKEQDTNCKNDKILKVFRQWFDIKRNGNNLSNYFVENNYKTVAVYGLHYLGECLVNELLDNGIDVKYAIDKNAETICAEADIEIYTPDENLPAVDVIVVTAFYFFDDIEDMLYDKVDCPIISLEDIVYEV